MYTFSLSDICTVHTLWGGCQIVHPALMSDRPEQETLQQREGIQGVLLDVHQGVSEESKGCGEAE